MGSVARAYLTSVEEERSQSRVFRPGRERGGVDHARSTPPSATPCSSTPLSSRSRFPSLSQFKCCYSHSLPSEHPQIEGRNPSPSALSFHPPPVYLDSFPPPHPAVVRGNIMLLCGTLRKADVKNQYVPVSHSTNYTAYALSDILPLFYE